MGLEELSTCALDVLPSHVGESLVSSEARKHNCQVQTVVG